MKITLTIVRIILFFVAFELIILGSLSVIQHWSHGRLILCAGLLLATIMFVEARNRQKIFRIITQVLLVVTAAIR